MQIKFKHQQFQLDAVQSVVDCFAGQPNRAGRFVQDLGKRQIVEVAGDTTNNTPRLDEELGFKNNAIQLTDHQILTNIQSTQQKNKLEPSQQSLNSEYNLTIEMETGTGKTYTYIRTMFELYQKYGWGKFIVVVPSLAIREGVLKTFQMTSKHFIEQYGIQARHFVYNSKQLHDIDQFASDSGINVMIINSQAFAARGKDARRIYMELDEFATRRPIDVIASTNPILIIDEPQTVEGRVAKATREGIKEFNALFTLRYSATHREDYNKIFRLDALDAYNMKLVKKITVKGISVKGANGAHSYLYLEGIDISNKHAPIARLEYEVKTKTVIIKRIKKVHVGDHLYELSGKLEQYQGYKIAEIDARYNRIIFTNGEVLEAGEAYGYVDELQFRRIQIRETIQSHFERERRLFTNGIKVLSLFFIDEVARYRQYDENNKQINGIYAEMFVEEYNRVLAEQISTFPNDPYTKYLESIEVEKTHKGYFSIDKKKDRLIDPKFSAREPNSDDVDAYDLIMKDKEKLLSLTESTRFIFSHSALKEGWDNPNVFQICTLKHSDSTLKKRQEVGRGLRLCVNQQGERVDSSMTEFKVHDINVLTVIASESYDQFAKELQKEIADTLFERSKQVNEKFFEDQILENIQGERIRIDFSLSEKLVKSMLIAQYLNMDSELTPAYFKAVEQDAVIWHKEFEHYTSELIELLKTVYSENQSISTQNSRENNVKDVNVNHNFQKKEFQELWNQINRKSMYTVRFDSQKLIQDCIMALDLKLHVPVLRYDIAYGAIDQIESKEQLLAGESLQMRETHVVVAESSTQSTIKYDLIGKLMDETDLTRKTIFSILKGIDSKKFDLFKINPEEFIRRTAKLINEEKVSNIIASLTYAILNETYNSDIFTQNTLNGEWGKNAIPVEKHIYDYLVTDSKIETAFAQHLDISGEVQIYAKLPSKFSIPTPMGKYNPDWAIVFTEKDVQHIYFIAETKGSMDASDLRGKENAKIACARKHFAQLNKDKVKYDVVDSYEKLIEIVKGNTK
ncbi:type III restriction-modification system endonuclease [Paenibacillus kyungheensis]